MTEPEKPLADDDRPPAVEPPPAERPDWLVGADEGVAAEQGRQKVAGTPLPFKLSSAADRASDPEVMKAPEETVRPLAPMSGTPPGVVPPNPIPPAAPKPVAWTAAASSVPTLKTPAVAPATSTPKSPAAAAPAAPARGGARSNAVASEPPVRTPLPDLDPPAGGEEAQALATVEAPPPRPRPRVRPLEEPWWVILLDALRANRPIQLGILGGGLVVLTCWLFWPHSEPGVSLRNLRKDPARWDGHIVRVEGRVGDVFPMGDGYAFNLHQGRDTIVVFTRAHKPEPRQNVTVVGSVTTGFLDGTARQAIFEN
ncbi:MAG TPA: hypothetical protein VMJ70_01805 [Candidatus Sulfotelmatobacter sp.]|nr:hypothetical protein [Candidatus Sulfotelmatobacter sp.]